MDFLASIGLTEPVIQFMLINAILGLSIYITLHTGMFSLAQAGFMAIGAYAGVLITQQLEQPLWVGVAGGMVIAMIIAVPIGLPVLRLQDIYLAIATIGFGEVIRIVLLNFDKWSSDILTQLNGERVQVELIMGARGIKNIPKLTETWHLIAFLVIAGYILTRLNRSRFGRAMAAIRQDEQAAASMGINVVLVKNIVFIMSAALAAAAGALSGHLTRVIVPNKYGFDAAVDILAYAVLGGTSTWIGPVVGGMVMGALPELLRFLKEYRNIFNGIVLLGVIVFLPGGLINPKGWSTLWKQLRKPSPSPKTGAGG